MFDNHLKVQMMVGTLIGKIVKSPWSAPHGGGGDPGDSQTGALSVLGYWISYFWPSLCCTLKINTKTSILSLNMDWNIYQKVFQPSL